MRYVMDGLRFTMLNETPCADPHAGCCGLSITHKLDDSLLDSSLGKYQQVVSNLATA